MRKTKSATTIIERMIGEDVDVQRMIEKEKINATVAQIIYDARKKAGLTQKELAELVGTKEPVIERLENADYEGHLLSMLQRISKALNMRLIE